MKTSLNSTFWLTIAALSTLYVLILYIKSTTANLHGAIAISVMPFLIWVTVADMHSEEIPDLATFAVAILGFVALLSSSFTLISATLTVAALLLVCLWWLGHLYWRRTGREALGIGDAKLLAAGTLMVGAERFWLMLLLASLGGIVAALISRRRREEGIPFGPFIAYAIFATFTMSDPVP